MGKVKVKYLGKSPGCVDNFPKKCERSITGALHLLPGHEKDITEDEYKHICDKHPEYKLQKIVMSKMEALAQKRNELKAQKAEAKAPEVEAKEEKSSEEAAPLVGEESPKPKALKPKPNQK
jgi:hypothetical protein